MVTMSPGRSVGARKRRTYASSVTGSDHYDADISVFQTAVIPPPAAFPLLSGEVAPLGLVARRRSA